MNKEILHSTQCLFLVSVTHCVHVQGVHGEVVRVQVEGLEKLLHRYFFPLQLVHDAVGIHAVGLLDEAQQMLLVHAGRGVDVCVHLEGQRKDRGGDQRSDRCANNICPQEEAKDTQATLLKAQRKRTLNFQSSTCLRQVFFSCRYSYLVPKKEKHLLCIVEQ